METEEERTQENLTEDSDRQTLIGKTYVTFIYTSLTYMSSGNYVYKTSLSYMSSRN